MEGWLMLAFAPRWLLLWAVPGALELTVPVGVRLVVPGCITLTVPARVLTLLAPPAVMAVVPGWAVGWSTLMVWVGVLLMRQLLAPRGNGMRLVKLQGLATRDLIVGPRALGGWQWQDPELFQTHHTQRSQAFGWESCHHQAGRSVG